MGHFYFKDAGQRGVCTLRFRGQVERKKDLAVIKTGPRSTTEHQRIDFSRKVELMAMASNLY